MFRSWQRTRREGPKRDVPLSSSPTQVVNTTPDSPLKPKATGWRRWFGGTSKVQPPGRTISKRRADIKIPSLALGKALLSAKSQATSTVASEAASSTLTTAAELGRTTCTYLDWESDTSSNSSATETTGCQSTPPSSRNSLDVPASDASAATKSGTDTNVVEHPPKGSRQKCSVSSVATIASVAPSPDRPKDHTAPIQADITKPATHQGSDVGNKPHDQKSKASMSAIVSIVSTVSTLDTLDSAPCDGNISAVGTDATPESPDASGASLTSESPDATGASPNLESPRASGAFLTSDSPDASRASLTSESSDAPDGVLSFGFPAPPGVSLVPESPDSSVVSSATDASPVSNAAADANDLATTSPAPKPKKKAVRFPTPNRSAVDKVWRKNKGVLVNNAMITISAQDSAKLKDKEYENTSLKQDKKDLLVQLSQTEKQNKYLGKRNADFYVKYEKIRGRAITERYNNEQEGTTTKADLKDQLQKTQAAYQNLEETRKQESLALSGEFADFKQKSDGVMTIMRANYDNKVVELIETQASRDSYKDLYEKVLARPTQAFSKPNIIAGFRANEQEKKDLTQALDSKTKDYDDCQNELVALRVDYGRRGREISELKDEITKVSSAKDYLEAKAVPIDFVGVPSDLQAIMDRKDAELVDLQKTVQIQTGTIQRMAKAKGKEVDDLVFENHKHVNQVLSLKNDALQAENDEHDQELANLKQTITMDQTLYTNADIRMEEMQVELHAANDTVRTLQIENAKGDADRADPRSWLHMKSCSERATHAELRQEQLQSRLDAYEKHDEECFTLVTCLWRRAFAFEELFDPSQMPAELYESRGFLRTWTLQSFDHDIDLRNPDQVVETQDEEIAKLGFYPGPHDSPDNWIAAAAAPASQSFSNQSPTVHPGSTSSSTSSSYTTPPSSAASPDSATEDSAAD